MSLSGEVGLGELTARVAGLAVGEVLTIAEFRSDAAVRWRVRIDRRGTPRVTSESASWTALSRNGEPDERVLALFLEPADGRHLLIAGDGSSYAQHARHLVSQRHGGASVLAPGGGPVDKQLDEATARVPLSQGYELCLLRPDASGTLSAHPQRLFDRGDRRGVTRKLRVYCQPGGPAGTTFAVLARGPSGYSGVVCMASGDVRPGPYTVTATLRRPGVVSFDGLGVELRKETRTWRDVFATIPRQSAGCGAAHLIMAVETCGHAETVAAHLDRAVQLVSDVAWGAESPVSFSLLAYGAHPHNVRVDEDPVTILAWQDRPEPVLAQLSALGRQAGTRLDHYAKAANIECMLGRVAGLLRDDRYRGAQAGPGTPGGRPVLVTVGSRVPFPAWRDPATEILPCPSHYDWQDFVRALREDDRNMAFGAVCGGDRGAAAWRALGADASAELIAVDAWQFAADLRLLRPPGEYVPFPLVPTEAS